MVKPSPLRVSRVGGSVFNCIYTIHIFTYISSMSIMNGKVNVEGDSSKLLEFVCYNGADDINVRNKAGIHYSIHHATYGSSEISAHVRSNLCYLNCLRQVFFFSFQKDFFYSMGAQHVLSYYII